MTEQEKQQILRRYQGKVSRIQGQQFEDLISAGCDYYRDQMIADIEKTPEPMKPIKSLGGGRFVAVYTKEAQCDYKGYLRGGKAVYFEAKSTDTGRMEYDRLTENQRDRLDRAYQMGTHSFVLVCFGMVSFHRVPWPIWRDMKKHFGHKYITPQEVAAYRLRIAAPDVLMFLDNLNESEDTP